MKLAHIYLQRVLMPTTFWILVSVNKVRYMPPVINIKYEREKNNHIRLSFICSGVRHLGNTYQEISQQVLNTLETPMGSVFLPYICSL
jgi:hypothetical protein